MNTVAPESIRDKLIKIQALAASGVDGERESARALLATLCRKHGITLESLVNAEKQWRRFTVSKANHKLFVQCACFVLRVNAIQFRRVGSLLVMECTATDHIDLKACFAYYRKLLKKDAEDFYIAFISKHRIFSGIDSGDASESPFDAERIARLIAMMRGMSDRSWVRPAAQLTA